MHQLRRGGAFLGVKQGIVRLRHGSRLQNKKTGSQQAAGSQTVFSDLF
jgi:hypothetical protein